jgi:hypothetical protein
MFIDSDMTPGMLIVSEEGVSALFNELGRADEETAWMLLNLLLSGAEFARPVAMQISLLLITLLTEGPEATRNQARAELVANDIPL